MQLILHSLKGHSYCHSLPLLLYIHFENISQLIYEGVCYVQFLELCVWLTHFLGLFTELVLTMLYK